MKEEFTTYQSRVEQLVENRACFPPQWEWLCTAPGLAKKFDETGYCKKFYGDTVIFYLPEDAAAALAGIQNELYTCAGHLLSQPLPPETFHITLHDLCAGESTESVRDAEKAHGQIMPSLLDAARPKEKLALKSVGVVSMVASSLVMVFTPATQADHEMIQELYQTIDPVLPLSYPLTLHCTLAYYKPGTYPPEQWNPLLWKADELNSREPLTLELDCKDLKYQHFASMKEYVD